MGPPVRTTPTTRPAMGEIDPSCVVPSSSNSPPTVTPVCSATLAPATISSGAPVNQPPADSLSRRPRRSPK